MCDRTLGRAASSFFFVLTALSIRCGPVLAETLELHDGTVIQGEIKSLQDNVYTVETEALGTVRVPKQNVRTIDSAGRTTTRSPASESSPTQPQIEAMQLRMIQDSSLLAMLLSLQNNAEVQAILADPEIMSALASGNFEVLMNHPKILALTDNAKVREIIDQVQ